MLRFLKMVWDNLESRTRLRIIGALILIVGLASAGAVYLTAEKSAADAVGYEMIDGQAYPISPASSKRYVHDLEVYGGKAAVMADELNRWFSGLWQGTSLAYTIAFLAIVASLGCFFVASLTLDDGEDDRTGSGSANHDG